MNNKNQLERHLLTRCHTDESRIDEILEARYTFTGAVKPSLVLLPTGGESESSKPKSLLHQESQLSNDRHMKKRQLNTRIQMKNFFNETKRNQRKLKLLMKSRDITNWNALANKYNIPTIEEFIPINRAWQSYMHQLLFPGVELINDRLPGRQMTLSRLAGADFIGCLMTIVKARNKDLVGITGIVIYDNQHSFVICVSPDSKKRSGIGGVRFIPKRHTLFTFDVKLPFKDILEDKEEYIPFTLLGSRFEYRSVDRSTKKFKNHNVEDIV